jgi:hypothetical protein
VGMESVVFEVVAATRPKRKRSRMVSEMCMPVIWDFGLEFEACGFRCQRNERVERGGRSYSSRL